MSIEPTGALELRAQVHAALADVTRLRIVDLLSVGNASATELATAIGVPSNLLAHHLRALEQADLVVRHRSEGDRRRSYLGLGPAATAELVTSAPVPAPERLLFVCSANSARSHLAAALWRQASPIEAASAGTEPADRINPGAVAVARRHRLPLPTVAPQSLDVALRRGDLVVTVCDRAHEQLEARGWRHWSVPDPVRVGTPAAFDAAYEDLAARVAALAPRLAQAS